MNKITNHIFTETEKSHLEFVLQHTFAERSTVIDQLNRMKPEEVTRDVTPHYRILEFRPNGVNPGHGPMRPYICIEVQHENGTAPTAFTLYERNGYVFELEIYHADSSPMDLSAIMDGKVYLSPNTEGL